MIARQNGPYYERTEISLCRLHKIPLSFVRNPCSHDVTAARVIAKNPICLQRLARAARILSCIFSSKRRFPPHFEPDRGQQTWIKQLSIIFLQDDYRWHTCAYVEKCFTSIRPFRNVLKRNRYHRYVRANKLNSLSYVLRCRPACTTSVYRNDQLQLVNCDVEFDQSCFVVSSDAQVHFPLLTNIFPTDKSYCTLWRRMTWIVLLENGRLRHRSGRGRSRTRSTSPRAVPSPLPSDVPPLICSRVLSGPTSTRYPSSPGPNLHQRDVQVNSRNWLRLWKTPNLRSAVPTPGLARKIDYSKQLNSRKLDVRKSRTENRDNRSLSAKSVLALYYHRTCVIVKFSTCLHRLARAPRISSISPSKLRFFFFSFWDRLLVTETWIEKLSIISFRNDPRWCAYACGNICFTCNVRLKKLN